MVKKGNTKKKKTLGKRKVTEGTKRERFLFRRIIMAVLHTTFRRDIMAIMKLSYYTTNCVGF